MDIQKLNRSLQMKDTKVKRAAATERFRKNKLMLLEGLLSSAFPDKDKDSMYWYGRRERLQDAIDILSDLREG